MVGHKREKCSNFLKLVNLVLEEEFSDAQAKNKKEEKREREEMGRNLLFSQIKKMPFEVRGI